MLAKTRFLLPYSVSARLATMPLGNWCVPLIYYIIRISFAKKSFIVALLKCGNVCNIGCYKQKLKFKTLQYLYIFTYCIIILNCSVTYKKQQ